MGLREKKVGFLTFFAERGDVDLPQGPGERAPRRHPRVLVGIVHALTVVDPREVDQLQQEVDPEGIVLGWLFQFLCLPSSLLGGGT